MNRQQIINDEEADRLYHIKMKDLEKLCSQKKWEAGDKNVDEFGQTDCVICMDPFVKGKQVR